MQTAGKTGRQRPAGRTGAKNQESMKGAVLGTGDPKVEEWMRDPGFRSQVKEWLKDADPSQRGKVDDHAEIAERIRRLQETEHR